MKNLAAHGLAKFAAIQIVAKVKFGTIYPANAKKILHQKILNPRQSLNRNKSSAKRLVALLAVMDHVCVPAVKDTIPLAVVYVPRIQR